MTRSTIIKRLAVCVFTAAATATLSSMAVVAGRAEATSDGTAGGPSFNAGGNLPTSGLGSPVIQKDTGTTGIRPGNGPGYNAGNGLPLAGGGSPVIQPGSSTTLTVSTNNGENPPTVISNQNPPVRTGNQNPPTVISNQNPPVGTGNQNPPTVISNQNPPTAISSSGGNPNVPEPISVLGTLTASLFGARFMRKRKQMQAFNSNDQA